MQLLAIAVLALPMAAQAQVTPMVIDGPIELSAQAADAAARDKARGQLRLGAQRRAETVAGHAPRWLPERIIDRAVSEWLIDIETAHPVVVLEQRRERRWFTYGEAWSTTLVVETPSMNGDDIAELRRRLRWAGRLFAAKCGGTVVFWVLLALFSFVLDRATRGYMTRRLQLLTVVLGGVVTTLALLC